MEKFNYEGSNELIEDKEEVHAERGFIADYDQTFENQPQFSPAAEQDDEEEEVHVDQGEEVLHVEVADDMPIIEEAKLVEKVQALATNYLNLEQQNTRLKQYIRQLRDTVLPSSSQCSRIKRDPISTNVTGECSKIIALRNEDLEQYLGEAEENVLERVQTLVDRNDYYFNHLAEENQRLKTYVNKLRKAILESKTPADSNHGRDNTDSDIPAVKKVTPSNNVQSDDWEVPGEDNEDMAIKKLQVISKNNQSLEARNKRLKNYIIQLRKTVLASDASPRDHANIPSKKCITRLDFVDELPEDIENVEVEDLWMPGQNPLLNSLVLQNIFRLLDYKSLQDSRLVCQVWDDVAIPIMAKEAVISLNRWTSDENITSEGILKLQAVMEKGCWELFNNIQIEVQVFELPECQRLLCDFGLNVKTLEVEVDPFDSNLNPQHLHSILAEWCPNLEVLRVCNLKIVENGIEKLFETLGSKRPLQLTTLEFDVGEKDPKLAQILISIVSASPKLISLNGYFHPRILMEFFVRIQKKSPSITKNLNELFIQASSDQNHTIPIEILFQLDVEFSDKLKHLTLGSFNPYPRSNLIRVLKKFARSLETLVFYGQDNEGGNNYTASEIDLPRMAKLKTFKNFGAEEYRLKSMNFLSNMESLETLLLSGGHNSPLSKTRLDILFANCDVFMRNPHLKLKTLILLGVVSSIRTILTISRIFPNISTLYLKLGHGERGIAGSHPCEKQEWFREAAEAVFAMKTLRVLYLDFQEFDLVESMECENDLTTTMGILPELYSLTLVNGGSDDDGPRFLPYFLEAMFGKAPKLRHVKLVDFEMALTDAKNLFETMNRRKILLEITDDAPSLDDFC